MVSTEEDTSINEILDGLIKPQPISVKAPPSCYQDGKTYRKSRFSCIDCDFFDSCK
ncbi:MAG: hypothetical protein ACFFD2_15980 [Promethearchaeota archaeon]